MLANLFDDQSILMGIGANITLLKTARQEEYFQNREEVQFHKADPLNWISSQPFDFIYTRVRVGRWTG